MVLYTLQIHYGRVMQIVIESSPVWSIKTFDDRPLYDVISVVSREFTYTYRTLSPLATLIHHHPVIMQGHTEERPEFSSTWVTRTRRRGTNRFKHDIVSRSKIREERS